MEKRFEDTEFCKKLERDAEFALDILVTLDLPDPNKCSVGNTVELLHLNLQLFASLTHKELVEAVKIKWKEIHGDPKQSIAYAPV